MKRQWTLPVEETGTEESHQLAGALAAIAGPEFIRAVIDVKTAMDRFGGEAYFGCYRDKFHEQNGEYVKVGPRDVGEWLTLGFVCHYESVAKATNTVTGAVKEPDDKLTQPRPIENGHVKEADREALAAIEGSS